MASGGGLYLEMHGRGELMLSPGKTSDVRPREGRRATLLKPLPLARSPADAKDPKAIRARRLGSTYTTEETSMKADLLTLFRRALLLAAVLAVSVDAAAPPPVAAQDDDYDDEFWNCDLISFDGWRATFVCLPLDGQGGGAPWIIHCYMWDDPFDGQPGVVYGCTSDGPMSFTSARTDGPRPHLLLPQNHSVYLYEVRPHQGVPDMDDNPNPREVPPLLRDGGGFARTSPRIAGRPSDKGGEYTGIPVHAALTEVLEHIGQEVRYNVRGGWTEVRNIDHGH